MIGTFSDEMKKLTDRAIEKAGGAAPERAPIDAVGEDGSAVARVKGRSVRVTMATEEPLLAGETAWVSKTKDGQHIVHGGAH